MGPLFCKTRRAADRQHPDCKYFTTGSNPSDWKDARAPKTRQRNTTPRVTEQRLTGPPRRAEISSLKPQRVTPSTTARPISAKPPCSPTPEFILNAKPQKSRAKKTASLKASLERLGSGLILQAGTFSVAVQHVINSLVAKNYKVGAVWMNEHSSPRTQ
ncbi:hypothetical protein B0T26DRAFT_297162 [Lasiosphaeria miniovina]|uniref:Uncharacterized protein n=1 Tax=Lasiosphaeria miniovina TaxID=1954250 RepID=A0AA40AKC2_9PEZI|nr:uncharacterized protein B0T26DRAFT_297162 [Lasiosphaeria miniovina]KAK0717466.1 hypothetical protein B0T26DRAFT_297162 [Lasiosphaeria miniovina]